MCIDFVYRAADNKNIADKIVFILRPNFNDFRIKTDIVADDAL